MYHQYASYGFLRFFGETKYFSDSVDGIVNMISIMIYISRVSGHSYPLLRQYRKFVLNLTA